MMIEYHIVYILISTILFIIIGNALFVDTKEYHNSEKNTTKEIGNWKMALLLIMINFLFIILATTGFFQIEIFYIGNYWSGNGTYFPDMFSFNDNWYFAGVWFGMFFINLLLMIMAGSYALKEAVLTEGQIQR